MCTNKENFHISLKTLSLNVSVAGQPRLCAYKFGHHELSKLSVTPVSDTATLEIGSLKTDSSVLLVVRGGKEVSGAEMPSDSEMA